VILTNKKLYENLYDFPVLTKQSFLIGFMYSENHNMLVDILVLFILSCITLIVIATPLILIFFWIHYSWKYIKNFKRDKGFKQLIFEKDHDDIQLLPKSRWPEYRIIYSKMIGFAVSIFFYSFSSIVYMLNAMNEFNVALKEYFSFPIKVYESLNSANVNSEYLSSIKELSIEMLLIVCFSVLVFFIVYFIIKVILDVKFGKEINSSMFQ